MSSIAARRADPSIGGLAAYEDNLLNFLAHDLLKALTAIETVLMTTDADENILMLTFELLYADPREMIRAAAKYQSMASAAMSAFAACKVLHARKGAELKGEPIGELEAAAVAANVAGRTDIPSDPAGQLAHIADAIKTQIHRCYVRSVRETAVTRYFKTKTSCDLSSKDVRLPKLHRFHCEASAFALSIPQLHRAPLSRLEGGQRHGWYASGREFGLITLLREDYLGTQETDLEKLRNLLIYFAPRSEPGDLPSHKLPKLPSPSPTRGRAVTAISTLVTIPKHCGLHTQWAVLHKSRAGFISTPAW